MSNKALNWAEKISLPRGEKTLLLILANKFNDKKGCCYPTNKTLAKWCSCKERTIRRYIKSLISKNIIQKIGDIRNPFGHRVTTKYSLNFDLKLDSLPDKLSCGESKPYRTLTTPLPDIDDTPTGQVVRQDYIINQNINQKRNKDFSPVDNFNEQKIQTAIGVKFEQLRKIYDDSYDIQNARRLFFKLCVENEQPIQFAENLIKIRKCQIIEFKKQTGFGKLMPTPCSLTNWLKGARWNDIIKPLGEKKKVTTCVKCKRCGEEYLRGTTCRRCEELAKPRLVYA